MYCRGALQKAVQDAVFLKAGRLNYELVASEEPNSQNLIRSGIPCC